MNIQIFGKNKCHDTKKAQRFFKERSIRVQYVDVLEKPMSPGEIKSVLTALGAGNDVTPIVDENGKDFCMIHYLTPENQLVKLCEDGHFLKTPIVRNGKSATIGNAPEIWKQWIEDDKKAGNKK